jgi:hypothetical protein
MRLSERLQQSYSGRRCLTRDDITEAERLELAQDALAVLGQVEIGRYWRGDRWETIIIDPAHRGSRRVRGTGATVEGAVASYLANERAVVVHEALAAREEASPDE